MSASRASNNAGVVKVDFEAFDDDDVSGVATKRSRGGLDLAEIQVRELKY